MHKIIKYSFLTVAKEFNLSEEDAPTNPAYITLVRLSDSTKSGIDLFLANDKMHNVGCIAI